jgi:hypothetical protein
VIPWMGSPMVYTKAGFQTWAAIFLRETKAILDKIVNLNDSHRSTRLLLQTMGICKIMHIIRTLPMSDEGDLGAEALLGFRAMLVQFDVSHLEAFTQITTFSPDLSESIQIGLPNRLGGIGLRSASLCADAAYLSASIMSGPLVARMLGRDTWLDPELGRVLQRFNDGLPEDQRLDINALPAGLKQHDLLDRVAKVQLVRLLAMRPDALDHGRLLSLRQSHSLLDALSATPDPLRRLWLRSAEFNTSISYLLGRVPHAGEQCMVCDGRLDATGFHAISGCPRGPARVRRHNEAVKVISDEAIAGNVPRSREVALLPTARNPARQADVLFPNFERGHDLAVDVTVVAIQQAKYLNVAAVDATRVHVVAAREKRNKYREAIARLAEERGLIFQPLVADTYGNWSEEAHALFKRLTRAAADACHVPVPRRRKQFYQRLAITQLRYQAWAIMQRIPRQRP